MYHVYVFANHRLETTEPFTDLAQAKAAAHRGADKLHNAGVHHHIIVADASLPLTAAGVADTELEIFDREGCIRQAPTVEVGSEPPLERGKLKR